MLHFERAYRDRRVLLTGHTGFKGSWLAQWLAMLGADVTGLALAPEADRPSIFDEARVADITSSRIGDIRNFEVVQSAFEAARPSIVFHLAAQPLVRRSFLNPIETFASNVMGTAHVLEAARKCSSVEAIVCVTTDKVYENRDWIWGYRENDQLGGKDPYSASKAACEMVASAYQTLYNTAGGPRLAVARGGNVIGGGDWSEDRIVVDIVRAIESNAPLILRNPAAVRPWQHVLELCRAYLVLGSRLLASGEFSGAWNFGPGRSNEVTVGELSKSFLEAMGQSSTRIEVQPAAHLPETNILRLDNSKAHALLDWTPLLDFPTTIAWTADWYRRRAADPQSAGALVREQIGIYRAMQGA